MRKIVLLGVVFLTGVLLVQAADPWMIVAIPDTQNYVKDADAPNPYTAPWTSQMNWIVTNRDTENIRFVTHEGDVVNGAGDAAADALEWEWARPIMNILDNDTHPAGVIPYSVTEGNHDDSPQNPTDAFLQEYGPARYETPLNGGPAYDWYGGHSDSGMDHYQTFYGGGRKFLHLNLANGDSDTDWAESVLSVNSNLPTIITVHANIKDNVPTVRNTKVLALSKQYSQVFMVLNGHYVEGWKGQARIVSTNDAGQEVYEMCSNMQNHWAPAPDEGQASGKHRPDGWFRTITFIDGGGTGGLDRIHMKSFSPWMEEHPEWAFEYDDFDPSGTYTNGFYIHPESDYTFDLDFASRLGPGISNAIQINPTSLNVPEGSTNTFDVRLTLQPDNTTTVTVRKTFGDGDLSVTNGGTLTFTTNNWGVYQPVTLFAVEDDLEYTNGTATIQCSSAGLPSKYLTATEIDNDEDPDYLLPFTETFEDLTLGILAGQHGWTGGGTVQTSTVHGGSQALALTNETAGHTFADNPTNVWVTLWAQPVFSAVAGIIPSNAVAPFYINTNAQIVAYSNATPITITTPTVSNGWNKFEVFCDYSSKVWKLSLNGTELFDDFAFYSDQMAFSALELIEGPAAVSYFDDLEITDSQNDSDGDGLPDDWEILYYGDTSVSPTTTASNGINTVKQTYIAGLNPTNPDSFFVLESVEPLQWTAASGRVYTIWWTSNLLSSFQSLETNYTGGAFTDLIHNAEQEGFYKIDVRIE